MKVLKVGVGVAVAAAAGCAWIPSVGPDYERPEAKGEVRAMPDAGQPTSKPSRTAAYEVAASNADSRLVIDQQVLTDWWKRFNDPVLNRLVFGAVSNNLSYKMALKRLDQANWELLGSSAAFMPKFGIGALGSRYWYNENTRNGYTTYNLQQATLDGKWEIDIFGGSRRLTQSAYAQAEAEGWSVSDSWVALTTQLGAQYVSLRTTQARLDVARTNLVLQSETYDILKSRLDSGIGDELAVNQCAYIVEQTRARIPELLDLQERLMNAIEILAGEKPGTLREQLRGPTVPRDWLVAPQRLSDVSLDLIRARPDVRAAERRLAAQTYRIGVAKSAWYPKLYLNATVGFEQNKKTTLFTKDSFLASLGPAVSWPIFQGGAIYADVKKNEAKTEELALAYELAIDQAHAEVRDAYSAYTQEYHKYQSLERAVKAATDAVTISKDLYKNGLKDFNNVLDAQRSRLSLEEQKVVSRGQITLSLIELYRALGGGLAIPDESDDGAKRDKADAS